MSEHNAWCHYAQNISTLFLCYEITYYLIFLLKLQQDFTDSSDGLVSQMWHAITWISEDQALQNVSV